MDAEQGIHDGNERFMEAVRAADSATMPSLYTTDAVILPPNGDAVSGAVAIAQYWHDFTELGITDARPETLEVIPMGDYALEVGETTVYAGDGTLLDRGKIMLTWAEPRITSDTSDLETPARSATSRIVGRRSMPDAIASVLPRPHCPPVGDRRWIIEVGS